MFFFIFPKEKYTEEAWEYFFFFFVFTLWGQASSTLSVIQNLCFSKVRLPV